MDNWKENETELELTLQFKDFKTAWAFMNEVAIVAEEQHHHPTWTNTYNTVDIELSTHDEGNVVTDYDYKLAASINTILEKYEYEHTNS